MARIKIEIPSQWLYSFKLQIRVTDLNYGNHLANEKVLSFAQEARVQFLKHYHASEIEFFGTSLIQGDAAIEYKSEGFLGNEIEIKVGVYDLSNSSFDFVYEMTNTTTQKPLALAKTRMVCFDYSNRKVTVVPNKFKELVTAME
ncbi:MAG: thioesterase family protein [Flavobacteriales bacterium]|nr:thioesterase family protein [Flavobacteriales bacterium]